jgi:hypothetical protein
MIGARNLGLKVICQSRLYPLEKSQVFVAVFFEPVNEVDGLYRLLMLNEERDEIFDYFAGQVFLGSLQCLDV